MNVYAICYDLNRPGQNYPALIEKIREMFDGYWHHLDSTWIVQTYLDAVEIRDALRPYIDSGDELLVVGLTGEGAWSGFSTRASEWLRDVLGSVPSART